MSDGGGGLFIDGTGGLPDLDALLFVGEGAPDFIGGGFLRPPGGGILPGGALKPPGGGVLTGGGIYEKERKKYKKSKICNNCDMMNVFSRR